MYCSIGVLQRIFCHYFPIIIQMLGLKVYENPLELSELKKFLESMTFVIFFGDKQYWGNEEVFSMI